MHILSSNKVWLSRWTGKTAVLLKAEDFPTIEAVKEQWNVYHIEIDNYILSITDKEIK